MKFNVNAQKTHLIKIKGCVNEQRTFAPIGHVAKNLKPKNREGRDVTLTPPPPPPPPRSGHLGSNDESFPSLGWVEKLFSRNFMFDVFFYFSSVKPFLSCTSLYFVSCNS